MKEYDVDFKKLFMDLIPVRRCRLIAFLGVIASLLQSVHSDFLSYRDNVKIGLMTQNCYLRGLLNDWFDAYERRIRLRNIKPNYDAFLLWKKSNNKPIKLSNNTPFLLQNEKAMMLSQIDFEVILPKGYTLDVKQLAFMKKIIDENKLPSKKYVIRNG